MEQLSELDSNFVLQETSLTPMHISPIVVYEQSSTKKRVRFKQILKIFEHSLHKSTVFRRKLAGGAMGLDTPYWVEDPNFDLEFHVRHIALPAPGDWRQLCILLARLQARGLDMKRPLWEAYVIEGLNDVEGLPKNSFAIMFKVHHSAIDGVSGAEIVTAIHSLTNEIKLPKVKDNWQGEEDPSNWTVWSKAYMNNLKRPVKFIKTASTLIPSFIKANKQAAGEKGEPRAPMTRTRFNGKVGAGRVTDTLILELDSIKSIRKAVDGATVNDVMVSIVGGALRKYLTSKNELPEVSLSCGAPLSTRDDRNSESTGNQVTQLTISLATDIEDPLERLQAVHESSTKAKEFNTAIGGNVMAEISQSIIPTVLSAGMRFGTLAAAQSDMPVPSHVIISNIPGPQMPLYLAGAKVHLMMGMGPLLHMLGLFHAVLSGAGKITINFVSCREMLPDPEFYKQCLLEAYKELEALT
jgi:diacylglycerol O-acyltransferase